MAEIQSLLEDIPNNGQHLADLGRGPSEGSNARLPAISSGLNTHSLGSKITQAKESEHPSVTVRYLVAENWGDFVEKQDARLCSRCQAFIEKLPQITDRLLTPKSENAQKPLTKPLTKPVKRQARVKGLPENQKTTPFYRQDWLRTTFESLECSASTGCPLCAMLAMVLAYYTPEERGSVDVVSFRCEKVQKVQGFIELRSNIRRRIKNREDEPKRSPLRIQQNTETWKPPVPRLRGASTDSSWSLNRAKEWYDYCRNCHPECMETLHRKLPTRLLHYKNGHLRLCNTTDVDVSTRYATLSHCWGKLPMFKLTVERMKSFETNIEIKDLSRTFQDALRVLTYLGLEFLWIDSLCIVQDDPNDWNRESLLMSSVFGFSDISIAAASSTDGGQGCFYEREMPVERVLHVSIGPSNESKTYTIYHPPHPEIDWHSPLTHINRSPLFSRGWVCQERILAPRVLIFNSSYLYWGCTAWNGPEWRKPEVDEPQDPHKRVGRDFDWRHIMRVCSRSQLTFSSDRLVSISGIAQKFRKLFPDDEYVAGMWRKDLERLLCWSVDAPQQDDPQKYQAPSWSWASLLPGTEAKPPKDAEGIEEIFVKVLDIDITLAGIDPLGAVTRGIVRVRCQALLRMAPDGIIVSGERKYCVATVGSDSMAVELRFDSERTIASATALYLLPVFQDPGDPSKKEGRIYMQGLVLRPTCKCRGAYERIGHFLKVKSPGANMPKIFKKTGKMDFAKLTYTTVDRELLFEKSEGEQGPHFITIA